MSKKHRNLYLSDEVMQAAARIGGGNYSAGIEAALTGHKSVEVITNTGATVSVPGCIIFERLKDYIEDAVGHKVSGVTWNG